MDVLVYGAGSLGSLVGGLLARAHDVTLVGRDPHMQRVREAGLAVDGEIEAHTHPRAVTNGRDREAELALVTTKAYDTDAAASALATGEFEAVLSLQNGLTEERLVAALDAQVLSGTATYGARLRGPGRVECTGVGEVTLGALGGGRDPLADRIGAAFRDAGINVTVADDMPRRRWEKLAVNAGINAPTALAALENGDVATGPAAAVACDAATEVATVARAEGIDLSDRDAIEAVERVAAATAANHSSMRQDVDADHRTEVEAVYGELLERAGEHGLDAPVCRTLAELIRAWEVNAGVRDDETAV
ncbi:ketopantoate reductase family protein [Haloparvum sp. PAK95]|uniref:ketopantoate reductase family protein n=1 Tax=Haloparvum sp. PAK95 TaxID=3418962 RepID=UPI003D2F1A40